jgi:hypothetical protein
VIKVPRDDHSGQRVPLLDGLEEGKFEEAATLFTINMDLIPVRQQKMITEMINKAATKSSFAEIGKRQPRSLPR